MKTHIQLHQWTTYRLEENFHSPTTFTPERWLPESIDNPSSLYYKDQRHAVQVFSLGPRNCIGKNLAWAELRLILSRMLWNFDIGAIRGSDGAEKIVDWTKQKTWVLVQKEPLEVRLTCAQSQLRLM